jgi:hypothetical protein
MTRLQKQLNLWLRYWTAGACLRDALIACDREAKAKNSAVRRKARDEATENLLEFRSCIGPIEGSLPKALRKIADTLDGKRYQCVRPEDDIEKAVAAIFGGRNDERFLMKSPFSLREFKQKLASIRGMKPKDLREPDSFLRRTLQRRGYMVLGKSGRPKNRHGCRLSEQPKRRGVSPPIQELPRWKRRTVANANNIRLTSQTQGAQGTLHSTEKSRPWEIKDFDLLEKLSREATA